MIMHIYCIIYVGIYVSSKLRSDLLVAVPSSNLTNTVKVLQSIVLLRINEIRTDPSDSVMLMLD